MASQVEDPLGSRRAYVEFMGEDLWQRLEPVLRYIQALLEGSLRSYQNFEKDPLGSLRGFPEGLWRSLRGLPFPVVVILFTIAFIGLILVFTRIVTGYKRWSIETESKSPTKSVPIVPYWIPFLGHAFSFFTNLYPLIAYAYNTSNTGAFSFYLGGTTHTMVIMPSLVKQYFQQKTSALSNHDLSFWFAETYFGDKGGFRSLPKDTMENLHQQINMLMREPHVSDMNTTLTRLVEEKMVDLISFPSLNDTRSTSTNPWEASANVTYHPTPENIHVAQASLGALLYNFTGTLAGQIMMGSAFMKNNPTVIHDISLMDENFDTLVTGLPSVTRKMHSAKSARSRLLAMMSEFNRAVKQSLDGKVPTSGNYKDADMSDVAEVVRGRTALLHSADDPKDASAAGSLMYLWASYVNSNKLVTWMILHIFSDPQILSDIRAEISECISMTKNNKTLQTNTSALLKSCPLLKSTFYECLRLYTGGMSYKKVMADSGITLTESPADAELFGRETPQSYHVPQGTFLIIPHYSMQLDPRLWQDPETFNAHRFIVESTSETGSAKKTKSSSLSTAEIPANNIFNPWGGGTGMCKGRLVAEREVLLIVASFVHVWDVDPVATKATGGKVPERVVVPGKKIGGAGTFFMDVKGEVRVQLTRRV